MIVRCPKFNKENGNDLGPKMVTHGKPKTATKWSQTKQVLIIMSFLE